MDNELNNDKPRKKSKAKTYSGIVLKPIKIGSKYDWTKSLGNRVNGLSKKEYDNYKQNKIIK
jgi:hypothetical protein